MTSQKRMDYLESLIDRVWSLNNDINTGKCNGAENHIRKTQIEPLEKKIEFIKAKMNNDKFMNMVF